MKQYWIDDDNYLTYGQEDDYETVCGPVPPEHIEQLSLIFEEQSHES